MTPFEGTSTCIETARPLQLLEVLSSVCALVFLSSRSLTSLQTSGGPLTSSRITPDSLLPFVHPPPLSSLVYLLAFVLAFFLTTVNSCISSDIFLAYLLTSFQKIVFSGILSGISSGTLEGAQVRMFRQSRTGRKRRTATFCQNLSKSQDPLLAGGQKKTKQIPLSGL